MDTATAERLTVVLSGSPHLVARIQAALEAVDPRLSLVAGEGRIDLEEGTLVCQWRIGELAPVRRARGRPRRV